MHFNRTSPTSSRPSSNLPRIFLALAVALPLVTGVAVADDRDLLRDSTGDPYVFITMDTSGSMHWTPPCSERDSALDVNPWDGTCTRECALDSDICERLDPGPLGNASDWDPANPNDVKCVEFSVEYDLDCFDPDADPVPTNCPSFQTVTMDDADPAPAAAGDPGVEIVGSWSDSTTVSPYVGSKYIHDGNTGDGTKSVRFIPDFPETGPYHVYLFYNANDVRAGDVPVTITHADGVDKIYVDQRRVDQVDPDLDVHPDLAVEPYVYLGTWRFDAGTTGNVLIENDGTTGFVVVDTIHFSKVADDPLATCVRTGRRFQQPVCPAGDCYAPLNSDDPTSKLFQAKEALYEVLQETTEVQFGFGTYEQDNGRVKAKHWAYRLTEHKPQSQGFSPGTRQDFLTLFDSLPEFPVPDTIQVFGNGAPYDENTGRGDGWNCAYDTDSDYYPGKFDDPRGDAGLVGCFYSEPADLDDPWEVERARRLPKLGLNGSTDTDVWYREPATGQIYRVTYREFSGTPGFDDVIRVQVEVRECSDSSCNGAVDESETFYLELVSDYVAWDFELGRHPMHEHGYYHLQRNVEASGDRFNVSNSNDCFGLEPNDDTNLVSSGGFGDDDLWWDYTFKHETSEDPRGLLLATGDRETYFDVGDFVPLDWLDTHRDILLERMAPNTVGSAGAIPDFRTAVYWENFYRPSESFDSAAANPGSAANRRLRLADDTKVPLLAIGLTPIANSLGDFEEWYAGVDSDPDQEGWSHFAAERDIDWACREKFVLFLTDGNETCEGDPCAAAASLFNQGVSTYVIGFGLDDDESDLGCIAAEGGTGEPFLPRNKEELVEVLREILINIKSEARSFASASIPAIQSTASDKIYLSKFTPLPSRSVWPGEIDVFRQPLPLTPEKQPDTDKSCGGDVQSGCHLYEVGRLLVDNQAPDETDVSLGELRIGPDTSDRRVFYPQENLTGARPSELVLFQKPQSDFANGDTFDLEDLAVVLAPEELGRYYSNAVTGEELEGRVMAVIEETLVKKELDDDLQEAGRTHYVMGDVFHADPAVVTAPSDFTYFSLDVCGKIQPGDRPSNCIAGEDNGYRRFALENTWRRRMLMAATNDGQLHFFDAGQRIEATNPSSGESFEVFSDGTGMELFSYMPRLTLPVVREQATGSRHIYSVDGSLTLRDVFIDPVDSAGGATASEREWRTVLISGLREAGDIYESSDQVSDFVSGYFALDVTQPDRLNQRSTDVDAGGAPNDPPRESFVPVAGSGGLPSCLDFAYTGDGHQGQATGCDTPFPMELWTFTDTVLDGQYFLDEESRDGTVLNASAVGVRDLGDTWSRPVVGQIAVCEGTLCAPETGADLTTKHVAIFGGGLDPENKGAPERGTWLYMVDVETGEAIYKREIEGAASAEPAVIDKDGDGIFDVVYMATTAGLLYKVDLTALDANGDVPKLDHSVNVRDYLIPAAVPATPDPVHVTRVDDDGAWEPFPILDTGGPPFYFAPSTFFIPELELHGLAIGTGDREDLWVPTFDEGRFFVIVDEDFTAADIAPLAINCEDRLPITEACLSQIPWNQDPTTTGGDGTDLVDTNLLTDPPSSPSQLRPGWVMTFPEKHRLTAEPFLVSGILIFSMFDPIAFIPDGTTVGDPDAVVCARTGITRSFVVLAQNANPVTRLSRQEQSNPDNIDGTVVGEGSGTTGESDTPTTGSLKGRDRYVKIGEFTTAPFLSRTTKNAPVEDGEEWDETLEELIDEEVQQGVQDTLRSYFPRGSRFNSAFQIIIAALRNSTGVAVYAPVPIAVYPADWYEE